MGARTLSCVEYYGAPPAGADASCKKDGGVYSAGATKCPSEGMTGKCEAKARAAGGVGETNISHKGSVGDPKGSCDALGNVWTAAGK
jgi:hypothetical protein